MSKVRLFLKYWLPVVLWMIVVFSASADTESAQHSSRIIGPLVRWLFPHISEPAVNLVVVIVRKCAHVAEYAVLAVLFWRALRKPLRNDPRPWCWKQFGWSLLFVALYAASDESHQLLVPSREASLTDVTLDTVGGFLGLLAIWGALAWRSRIRRQRITNPTGSTL